VIESNAVYQAAGACLPIRTQAVGFEVRLTWPWKGTCNPEVAQGLINDGTSEDGDRTRISVTRPRHYCTHRQIIIIIITIIIIIMAVMTRRFAAKMPYAA